MVIELPSLIAFCGGVVLAMVLSGKIALRGLLAAQQIVKEGHIAQGRITGVWRPPVAGSFPRVYFEFQPEGSPEIFRCCHTDRRVLSGDVASLPAVGSQVTVRYLPEDPRRAVIARLVSRFTH
ncbi:hypothetical protein HNQ60_004776 [Povalibacter uvarum]|uniref:DUF3592 domain-containing protein n=1 Tax=Povalibacter uvarum TaxID=732238 RepID=A0A841HVQ2_9GAMM|nr:DUF3592 domain-containing protein [Povalibacter uvarum]MBB6095885.1 hypothetical protein [Povalibacter uvarum]